MNVAPPVVLVSPPKLVIVPNSPVKYAPEVNANLFFHEGRYYSLHDDRWLVASSHSGPWVVIEVGKSATTGDRGAREVLQGSPRAREEDVARRRRGKDCPPGQAKKGNR